jgi:hypothetical protein
MAREDEIRLIAYTIWEEDNCVIGQDCEHWLKAELIWEQRQKPTAKSTKAEPKQAVKQNSKVTGKKPKRA